MTGCHVGMITQIQQVTKSGFYCIWCAAHQLDLIVQDRFKSIFDDTFVHVIQVITGFCLQKCPCMRCCLSINQCNKQPMDSHLESIKQGHVDFIL